ncbi:cytochrome b [Sphingomonas populi]|uniref:Cytochrome b n=1 Tax=Sphingomonas populi TaxID=2484750 RepID=A0A4Q6Y2Y9_9SPHN|nr:cytochrome b [Sphingomonas populi]RZF63647.1 cytochrome b [Sphingomonas populi]
MSLKLPIAPSVGEVTDTSGPAAPIVTRPGRYSGMHQLMHWGTAVMMFVIIVLGWIMHVQPDSVALLPLWEWHKTLGLFVLVVTAFRLVWRLKAPPPPPLPGQPRWDHRLAQCTYAVFFATLIWMPATGYVFSTAGGYPPKLFNILQTPALFGKSPKIEALAQWLHLSSQWLIYGLILLHLAGVLYHVVIVRDRTLDRMLPEPLD